VYLPTDSEWDAIIEADGRQGAACTALHRAQHWRSLALDALHRCQQGGGRGAARAARRERRACRALVGAWRRYRLATIERVHIRQQLDQWVGPQDLALVAEIESQAQGRRR